MTEWMVCRYTHHFNQVVNQQSMQPAHGFLLPGRLCSGGLLAKAGKARGRGC